MKTLFFFFVTIFCVSCSQKSTPKQLSSLTRQQDSVIPILTKPILQPLPIYPWEERFIGTLACINKEFFRCRGVPTHPTLIIHKNDKTIYVKDCQGCHTLVLKEGKEFVYPILIELLNEVQQKTLKKVVITTGHRCPQHNLYADPYAPQNSKHMIAAEVDFYVEGLEQHPEVIVELLKAYYQQDPFCTKDSQYTHFLRDTQTQLRTAPWYNKEIKISIHQEEEGRDIDNQHGYPYITIQVCYDRYSKKKVVFQHHLSQQVLKDPL